MGFEHPTPIQEQSIPVALEGHDLIGCAQTGTGKTAAFGIPIIERLTRIPAKSALILAPTRELATQIWGVLTKLTAHSPELKSALLIGGVAMQPQVRALQRKPRIIVATPGRLVDHLQQRTVSFSALEVLVLDEADRMLDMGFAPQLAQILKHLPKQRQTLLFSATLPPNILQLAQKFLKDPVRVTVGQVSQPAQKVSQSVIETTHAKKNEILLDVLNQREGSVLIFTRTKHRTDRLARHLESYGHPVSRIHGGRSQGQRNLALAGFRDGKFRILVATDIAARGIDISHIAHVINYDLPQVAEDYVHRIGRTARAGAQGEALSILTPEDRLQWKEISKLLPKSVQVSTVRV
jgi:superfamily II DNA/RNA helicase